MFFIHGDKDTYVPTWMVYPLYEAKSAPKQLWIVPGAAHAVSYKENKEEYTRKVKEFTDRYIHCYETDTHIPALYMDTPPIKSRRKNIYRRQHP